MAQTTHRETPKSGQSTRSVGVLKETRLRSADDDLSAEQRDDEISVGQDSTKRNAARKLTDQEIVDGILRGDQDVCTYAYEKYYRLMCKGIRKVTAKITDEEMADELQIAAAFFFKESVKSWKPEHCLSTYAYNAAHWSRMRSLTQKNSMSRGGGEYLLEEDGVKKSGEATTYEERLASIATDLSDDMTAILDIEQRLSGYPRLLFVFKKHIIEGESSREVASALGVTHQRVHQLLRLALDIIKHRRIGRRDNTRKTGDRSFASGLRELRHCRSARNQATNSQGIHESSVHEARNHKRSEACEVGSNHSQAEIGLTTKEQRLVQLVADGMTNTEIAKATQTTENVVKNYIRAVFNKVGCNNRVELALWHVTRQHERELNEPEMFNLVRLASTPNNWLRPAS